MNKIKVYILENCKSCKKIKKLFKNSGYNILYLDSEKEGEMCDFLESITGNYIYPIVHIETPEKLNYIFSKSEVYDPLKSIIFLDKPNWIYYRCISVEDIINNVKKIINE